nr:MAG TPA: hypothetical protein [Caudoviricetes sp.]
MYHNSSRFCNGCRMTLIHTIVSCCLQQYALNKFIVP